MTKVELTRDAERDLIDIYLYGIKHFGPATAERYALIPGRFMLDSWTVGLVETQAGASWSPELTADLTPGADKPGRIHL